MKKNNKTTVPGPVWAPPLLMLAVTCVILSLALPDIASAANCSTSSCHADLRAFKNAHEPVSDGECEICHEQRAQNHPSGTRKDFTLADPEPALCFQCHDRNNTKAVIHDPVREGACTDCHNPHGSSGPALLDRQGPVSELCFSCHDEDAFSEKRFRHGPASAGRCLTCHDPHQSDYPGLLNKAPKEMCLFCHTDFGKGLEKARVVHPPIQKQSCIACHNPHGSDVKRFLKKRMPDLCTGCHEDIGEKMRRSRRKHKALYEGNRCGNCHNIHFSERQGLLVDDEMPLCLECHGKDDTKRSHPLRNIKKELEGKKYLHGPVEDGECTACHEVHGSDYWRILTGPYPESFYANYRPGIYGFCWQCHDSDILKFSYKEPATDFRNGKENLHKLHVARELKGRTCRACHAPHASDWPRMITKKGAPFGAWRIPIRYEKTETGGSCAPGCHKELKYDRKNPVSYNAGGKKQVKKRRLK